MSFVWFADKPLRTREQIASVVHGLSLKRGLDELATVIALMTIATEVGAKGQWWCPFNKRDPSSEKYRHDSESNDGRSVGYFQQQNGAPGETVSGSDNWWGSMASRMTLEQAADVFLDRLSEDYRAAKNNPALAGQFAQRVQGSAFGDRYAQHWDEAWSVLRSALKQSPPVTPAVDGRPDFNEFAIWSPSNQSRQATKVDLFLLHTQEGGGGDAAAENLANFLANPANEVSYHYTISQASDGGITVVDCVDTDEASWSVLSANNRSINLCFAGSRAAWTRDQWMKQAKAIDVAAYLAVQDCKKYGIPTTVIGMGGKYSADRAGIADHRYVTDVLKDGTHTDVGTNFPVDVFTAAVQKYAAGSTPAPTPPPTPPPTARRFPEDWTDREINVEILRQLRGPTLDGWPQLGGKSVVDYIAGLGKEKAP